jgi:proline dehydrogenase
MPRKKKLKKEKKSEEVYFIGIEDPVELRRNILESCKDLIEVLQMYEKFKETRELKKSYIERLKKDVKTISSDMKASSSN